MILHAKNKYEGSFVETLQNICSWDRELNDWSFTKTLKRSIELKGMLNPILVMSLESYLTTPQDLDTYKYIDHNKPYVCMIGNNRYLYAKSSGYTHIECLLINDPEELRTMTRNTLIKPRIM